MLNIEVNRSAKGVEQYFDCELAVSDYLMKEPGIWAGRGAERLELRGPVQRSQFVALLRNENPTMGKRLTARRNTSRQENLETVSVFRVSESLSVYLAITGGFGACKAGRFAYFALDRAMKTAQNRTGGC